MSPLVGSFNISARFKATGSSSDWFAYLTIHTKGSIAGSTVEQVRVENTRSPEEPYALVYGGNLWTSGKGKEEAG